jgi:hypothetical protein
MKLKFTIFILALMAGIQSWSQGLPFTGMINGANGSMSVNIFYVDSISGISGSMVVNSGPSGVFDGLVPVTGNVMGQMMVWACISNCQGLQVCDNTVWIPGTIMMFELEYCFGNLVDADGDGYDVSMDCNDNNQWVNPGQIEECNNGVDNDCDGLIDEDCGFDSTLFDSDNDGFLTGVDCNDSNPWVYPGAFEECNNGVDNDCDGLIDEDCTGGSCDANIYLVTDSMMNGTTTPFVVWVVNVTDPTTNAQYMWSTGDGGSMTGAFPTWQYSETGTYTLCLYMYCADGTVDTSCVSFNVDTNGGVFPGGTQQNGFTLNIVASIPNSVEELVAADAMTIYPNPASTSTTLQWTASVSEMNTIEVYNVAGQKVAQQSLVAVTGTNQAVIDMQNLSSGIYQVVKRTSNGIQTLTLMK